MVCVRVFNWPFYIQAYFFKPFYRVSYLEATYVTVHPQYDDFLDRCFGFEELERDEPGT